MNLLLLHPGDMGASIGACACAAGHRVCWVSEGRSAATIARAEAAGLETIDSMGQALEQADAVVSVCPPDAAEALAITVRNAGFRGTYVDANAIAPATARAMARDLPELAFVDGGIVGPPAWGPDRTRLFLSGDQADEVAGWFAGTDLDCVVVAGEVGKASAVKMCYAAWTKGSSALLLAVRAVAEREGVADALVAEWDRSQPGTAKRAQRTAAGSAPKAWRWVGEMEEIASTFESAGLPPGFHLAAAELFQQMAGFKDETQAVGLDTVMEALLSVPDGGGES